MAHAQTAPGMPPSPNLWDLDTKNPVAVCNPTPDSSLFPQGEENIAAYLNATCCNLPTK